MGEISNGIQLALISLCSVVIFHVLAILYGAPVLESSRETLTFATILTLTSVVPACCVFGLDYQTWVKVFILWRPETGMESAVFTTSVCSVVGAWLGAVPIPLDWDRPWQVWPISCVIGTLTGFTVGLAITALRHLYAHLRKHKLT